ncbi:MAG: YbaY family lipoprotein [Planctomycetaceae bacterium]|nr:YbaY family lipoprotein [Planctomycetaceae bacterium]MCA9110484.1 YbaY family lipoprotein [Planctomycetaceae bacterium]
MNLRNALRSAMLVALLTALSADAHAIDPNLRPTDRDSIIPQPLDPLFPSNNPTGIGNPGVFDPFAPANQNPLDGFGSTTQPNELRVAPSVIPAPGTPQEQPRWRLGIYSMDTGTGVQIVRVSPNSPASTAGLEPDDLIVTVSGYQVGLIENHRHELGQAFNQYATTEGYVNLLVQDHRTGNLLNMPVTLEGRFQRIEGTVSFRDTNTRLPRNAQVQVDLFEQIRPGVTIPIVTKRISDFSKIPIPFSVDYDPQIIDPRRQYTVQASIVADNNTYYSTRNPYQVITAGYPRTVDMSLYSTVTSNNSNSQQVGYATNRDEQLDQIVQWFRDYLNRDIRYNERQVWSSSIDRGESLDDVRAQLLGGPEFYTKSNQDDETYIRRLFEVVAGRQPTQREVDAWLTRLDAQNGLRTNLAREFLTQISQQR